MAKIAFIGVGDISGIYLKNVIETFDNLEIAGVCDLVPEKAQRAVEKYPQIPKIYKDMYEAFADHTVSNRNDPDSTVRQILRILEGAT